MSTNKTNSRTWSSYDICSPNNGYWWRRSDWPKWRHTGNHFTFGHSTSNHTTGSYFTFGDSNHICYWNGTHNWSGDCHHSTKWR